MHAAKTGVHTGHRLIRLCHTISEEAMHSYILYNGIVFIDLLCPTSSRYLYKTGVFSF